MSGLQGTAFVAMIAMVFVWFHCLRKLSRQLHDRHPEKYDEMELEDMWPKEISAWIGTFDNRRPVFALCRFLFRGEFAALDDPEVASLGIFMRRLAVVYLFLFGFLGYSIATQPLSGPAARGTPVAAVPATAPAPAPASEAQHIYSRAVEHWRARLTDEALADFGRVIELEPGNFEAYRQADHILANQQRWAEILEL
jgi:hypothetical protein